MGCCSSASTTAGLRKKLPEVSWHCGVNYCHGLEVEGIPLDRYLEHFSGLGKPEQHQVITKVIEEAGASAASGARAGVCHMRTARIGLLSWNVGGISDHRKDQGAGLEEAVQGAAAEVLSAAVADLGPADVIVVGLQEIISLTPSNAMKGTSSANESRHKSFYGWPETVAQWVELLAGGLNGHGAMRDHAYVLYGQPVYLFGLLLCVFCPASMLKHIRDFGMVEKPLDQRLKSGAKGAVACRFVLWDRSFCFLNCHLAASTASSAKSSLRTFKRRLQQLEQCWKEIKFKSHVNQMVYPVSAHRAVFLLGDTNMRLMNKNHCHQACQDFHSYTTNLIGDVEGGYRELWDLDQLCQELSKPNQPSLSERPVSGCLTAQVSDEGILSLWQEPLVDEDQSGPPFPPTFKLAVPGPGYSRKRVPAWTDRVLFHSDHAEPTKYGSVQQSKVLKPPRNLSDHDPVYAFFNVECTSIHPRRLGSLAREVRTASMGPAESPSAARRFPSTQQAQQAQALASGSAAQPEIEELSRRLFERLSEFEDPSDTAAASWLLQECQEECWKLLCRRMEFSLDDSIRQGADNLCIEDVPAEREACELDAQGLAKSLQEVTNLLRRELHQQPKPVMSKSFTSVSL